MKKLTLIFSSILAVTIVFAQHGHGEDNKCDCPSCKTKAAETYTLPGLEGFNKEPDHNEHNPTTPAEETHEECDHDHAENEHDHESHDDHSGHDHDSHDAHQEDACGDCEHGDEHSSDITDNIDIQAREATGGRIEKTTTFPAEIKLNRDQASAVSARFESVVRQVFAEIGDEVKKGDILASLENRENMSVYTVDAPLDGVIISKDLAVGEIADSNRILFEVADLSSIWADISIFPRFQHQIHKGMPVSFIAHDGHTATGTIKYVSPIVSHETRTFTARCILEGADEDFTPGAFVRARIITDSIDADVRVEKEALQTLEGETVIFIPTSHGFANRVVQTGITGEKFVEITSGLKNGEQYVASGTFALKAEIVTSGMDPHAGHGH